MDSIREICLELGYEFKNQGLLIEALTHSSWSNEHPDDRCNERLEFIGDAVLGFIVADMLYRNFPCWDEGKLTSAKSYLVGKKYLSEVACKLNLNEYVRLGVGEKKQKEKLPLSIGVNALEALIGAVFIDGGIENAARVVQKIVSKQIENFVADGAPFDPKSRLQELCLCKFGKLPYYRLVKQEGPDHEKKFVYKVFLPDGKTAKGKGTSKKEAQKNAAISILKLLE